MIDKINPTFIALTPRAIQDCLSAWETGEFRVPPEFGQGGAAQRKCDTRNNNHTGHNECTDVFRHLDAHFYSSIQVVYDKTIGNIHSMICRRIHSTCTYRAMAPPHNDQGSFDEDFLDYVLEELREKPDNAFHCLRSFVAATEASMQFPAVLPMGGSAIASRSQPIPCSNSNSKSNDITSIPKMTSIVNTGSVNGSTIVEGVMSLGG